MAKKQVVLFIVEGVNDETALALPLEKLLTNETVKFEITHGDLTSDFQGKNIAAKIGDCVRKHCADYKYRKEDFIEVILLVDMDGAYVNTAAIVQSSAHADAYYETDKILHSAPDKYVKSQKRKQQNLNHLITLPKVFGTIPFSVYFFSCNLDHVICDNANLSQARKRTEAEAFRAKYHADTGGFLAFFCASDIAVGTSYADSWDYIKKDSNSLKRCSNFHIFLSPMAKNTPRMLFANRKAP